ncbi:hypothetical protein [Patiriisocius marinus]|uniref:STAS/SEC14 domain-containing protein n=1 Tax=Patiriisocius marinus TaxID=1397112 RepID=A0A5J4J0V2_9FLAO|nr:hypothetical protein [Patiriisocius marinus]GER60482.1 hypothetical protein ULMA_25900 [Patiriisocius marinus]
MRDKLTFEFGEVSIFENYIIVVMNEGIIVEPKYNDDLIEMRDTYFYDRPFGYISHRKNSYSVDPKIYFETSKIFNLVAFAIVSVNEINIDNSNLEQKFLKQPIKKFTSLPEAVEWIESLV